MAKATQPASEPMTLGNMVSFRLLVRGYMCCRDNDWLCRCSDA